MMIKMSKNVITEKGVDSLEFSLFKTREMMSKNNAGSPVEEGTGLVLNS